jgi:hypothetical protein
MIDDAGRLRLLDAFNRHDLDGIMSPFAADSVCEPPRGPDPRRRRFEGKEAVQEGLGMRFAGIPDVRRSTDSYDQVGCGYR